MHFEALRQAQLRHFQSVEAVGLMTHLTVEVRVLVVIVLMAVTVAELIAHTLAAPFYYMHPVSYTHLTLPTILRV